MSFKRRYGKNAWIYSAIGFGVTLYLLKMFAEPIFTKEAISAKEMLIGIPIYALAGLMYGYWMKKYMQQKNKEKKNSD